MHNLLSIQVICSSKIEREEVDFFGSMPWTEDAEKKFLSKIQELFTICRDQCSKVALNFEIEAEHVRELTFQLNKRKNKAVEINTSKLTIREIEIVGLIMQGLTNKEISEKLFISFETAKCHRKHILVKTGCKNTAALVNHYSQTFFEK